MPNSQQWSDGVFFRFNPNSISREYDIPISELIDFQVFLVTSKHIDIGAKELISRNSYIYPLAFSDINKLVAKLNYPIKKDFWKSVPSVRIRGARNAIEFPSVMTIINMTPDSFYPGSRTKEEELSERLDQIRLAGGSLVDVGGQSTRPESERVSSVEEMKRISKAVEISLDKKFTVSVDSYRPEILRECLEMGAQIINDVTGMEDPEIGRLARKYDVPLVIMHKKGDFKTMQRSPSYGNVVNEIISFFLEKISQAEKLGISDNVILDPGIGFGKRVKDNLSIISNLRDFKLGHPLLIGLSRKNYIGELMNEKVEERAESSLIFNSIAVINGADIIRVHDPVENLKLIKIIKKLREV